MSAPDTDDRCARIATLRSISRMRDILFEDVIAGADLPETTVTVAAEDDLDEFTPSFFAAEFTAERISASGHSLGLVKVAISLFNRDGTCVMMQGNAMMVARRDSIARRDDTETRT